MCGLVLKECLAGMNRSVGSCVFYWHMGLDDELDLQAFVDQHYGRLVGLLRFKGASTADAEDLAQETMVRLVENWGQVRFLEHPWGWLVRVALNLSRSRWRRLQTAIGRRHLLSIEGVHYDKAAIEALAILDSLTERQRTAVVLRHYAGLSVRQTAELMGVAEGTVKSLCSGGLRAALADHQTNPEIAADKPIVRLDNTEVP